MGYRAGYSTQYHHPHHPAPSTQVPHPPHPVPTPPSWSTYPSTCHRALMCSPGWLFFKHRSKSTTRGIINAGPFSKRVNTNAGPFSQGVNANAGPTLERLASEAAEASRGAQGGPDRESAQADSGTGIPDVNARLPGIPLPLAKASWDSLFG